MKSLGFTGIAFVFLLLLTSCGHHDVVTYSKFRQIHPNMTMDQVERIIGHKGRMINGEHIDGVIVANPGEVVYFWQNEDQSNLSIATINGRVVNAAASGLN
ncbi:hypothetical protein [Asticcacaulis taihuensis]|jgi:hypothetical protein|uniref:hypothetical protein n=1 Tax=Asticcacaulis taihuensis TaxID=260084 RepID=UPI001114422F|nr:hypothetical protein [Asticcacaulis taihuensis]